MSKIKVDEMVIDGITYVPKGSDKAKARDGMEYVLVRTYSAGVHCGYLQSELNQEVTLLDSIRLWKWSGATACSQLAMEGVSNPSECKFEMPCNVIRLKQVVEVIPMTEKAMQSIKSVESWKE